MLVQTQSGVDGSAALALDEVIQRATDEGKHVIIVRVAFNKFSIWQ